MIRKIFLFFLLFSLIFTSGSLALVYAQEEKGVEEMATEPAEMKDEEADEVEYDFASMTTFEMFWPLVAGKVPGDKFYRLKIWRDKLMGVLFSSKLKKAEYLKKLANKRLIEAEKLLEVGRESYFPETIRESRDYLEKGLALLFEASETETQAWLRSEYAKDLRKHSIVLERMKEKAGEEQGGVLDESIRKINDLAESLRLKW